MQCVIMRETFIRCIRASINGWHTYRVDRNTHAVVFFQSLESMTWARARGSYANRLRFRVVLFRTFITVIIFVLPSISIGN